MDYIECNNIQFFYKLNIRRNSKKITMRIKENYLSFTSSYKLNKKEIKYFIEKNYNLILKEFNNLKLKNQKNNEIHYLGKKYNIKIIESNYDFIKIEDDFFIIYTKNNNEEYNKKIVHSFYKSFLKNYIDAEIINAKKIFDINFDIKIRYKTVKTYFGNCYFKKNIIDFNTSLAKYNTLYIKTVLYHELGHFLYHDHSNNFYNRCEMAYPGFINNNKNLRKIHYNDLY